VVWYIAQTYDLEIDLIPIIWDGVVYTADIYNINGQKVAELANETDSAESAGKFIIIN